MFLLYDPTLNSLTLKQINGSGVGVTVGVSVLVGYVKSSKKQRN